MTYPPSPETSSKTEPVTRVAGTEQNAEKPGPVGVIVLKAVAVLAGVFLGTILAVLIGLSTGWIAFRC